MDGTTSNCVDVDVEIGSSVGVTMGGSDGVSTGTVGCESSEDVRGKVSVGTMGVVNDTDVDGSTVGTTGTDGEGCSVAVDGTV